MAAFVLSAVRYALCIHNACVRICVYVYSQYIPLATVWYALYVCVRDCVCVCVYENSHPKNCGVNTVHIYGVCVFWGCKKYNEGARNEELPCVPQSCGVNVVHTYGTRVF